MFSLQSFSIRARFYIVLATVSCSLLALGVWGWASGVSANQRAAQLFDASNAGAIDVANLREAMSQVRRWEVQSMAVGATNTNEIQRLTQVWKAEIQSVTDGARRSSRPTRLMQRLRGSWPTRAS